MSNRGLEGVVIGESKICYIDGQAGELVYRGYEIEDLARHTTFEEVIHLLWHGDLPDRSQLAELLQALAAERSIPDGLTDLLRGFPDDAHPMAALRTGVSALAMYDAESESLDEQALRRMALRITAKIPTIIAAYARIRRGEEPVAPKDGLGTAGNFLYMLNGEEASDLRVRTMDAALVLHAEHGMNASTFSARVTAGTVADMYSAVTSAIGTLKGPAHGGANSRVMDMLKEIDASGQEPREWVREALGSDKRVMGFGHRVYKTTDPRAIVLRELAKEIMQESGGARWLDLSDRVRTVMGEEMEKQGKPIYPNVDFFSASVYTTLGVEQDFFTTIFAMSRVAGWTAHLFEQYADNRLIRPRAEYTGPKDRKVEPIDER
ncbi:MAG: citrate/2-methylcitrate synthase [Longimicrobiaceae bacterium]